MQDFLGYIEGMWRIERVIQSGGMFFGQGTFTRNGDAMAYHEIGDLTLDNGAVIGGAEKRYLYQLEAGSISVYFDDGVDKGKKFHSLEFISPTKAVASYPCGDDFYETTYAFDLPERFSITHKVTGKKKSYVSESTYFKLP